MSRLTTLLAMAWALALCAPDVHAAPRPASAPADTVAPVWQGPAPFGPLRIAERNPLYSMFLVPTVLGADVMAGGATRLDLSNAYSNIFEFDASSAMHQRFDFERLQTTLLVRQGIGRGVEVGAQVAVHNSWRGFLDPAIQWWHGVFGLPNASREQVPDNEFAGWLVRDGEAQPLVVQTPGLHIDAPRLFAAWQVVGGEGRRGALALRATAKLPVGDSSVTTRRTDFAVEAAGRWAWGRSHLHASGGLLLLDPPPALEAVVGSRAWFGSAGWEVRVAEPLALLVQFSGGGRYTMRTGVDDLDALPINFVVGGAGTLRGWGWQVSFAEDVPPNSPSVDFTLDLQIGRRW